MKQPEYPAGTPLTGLVRVLPAWVFQHPAEFFVLVFILAFGTVFVFAIPIGAGWDEETHTIRTWEMAFLELIPNSKPRHERPFPRLYWDLSYRRQPIVRPVGSDFWDLYGQASIGELGYIYSDLSTRSVYSPVQLFPQAMAFRYLGLRGELPALHVYYAARLAGLISYALLAWLSVRLVPFGKWTLATVILLPTALFQASTINADSISSGLGFLFIAALLSLDERQVLRAKEVGLLLGLVALLFFSRSIALVILPFLLIPRGKYQPRWGQPLFVLGVITLAVIQVIGWALIAFDALARSSVDPIAQLMFVIGHPLHFIVALVDDLGFHGATYVRQFIAEFGYDYWVVPGLTYAVFPLAIALALALDRREGAPGKRTRNALLGTFFVGALAVFLGLYLADNPVGSETIGGVQGRYFIGIAPALFLALIGTIPYRIARSLSWLVASGMVLLMLSVFTAGLFLSYHVVCGTSYYQPGRCYLPVYKNWAPNLRYSEPLDFRLEQSFVPECEPVEGVRLWMRTVSTASPGTLLATVRAADTGRVLSEAQVRSDELPQEGWVWIGLEGQAWAEEGQPLIVAVEPGEDGGIVQVSYTLRDEYGIGTALKDGTPLDHDLVFQYGCSPALRASRSW